MKRPTGVTILAILGFIIGGLHFVGAFLAFASGSMLSAQARSGYFVPMAAPVVDAFGSLGFWIGIFGMIAAAITLAAAGGLWVMSNFGYWLTIIAMVLNLIGDVMQWLGAQFTWPSLIGALFAVGVLVYLSRPAVREAFATGFPLDAPTRLS